MPETEIPEVADVECCPEYPSASAFGYACKQFSFFCWTCFWMSSGSVASRELPAREVLEARPVAEQAQCNVERSNTLTARSEPYNPPTPLHAQVDGR